MNCANKSTHIVVVCGPGDTPHSNSLRLKLETKVKKMFKVWHGEWMSDVKFFNTVEDAEEHIKKCTEIDLVYFVNHDGRAPAQLGPDAAVLGCAMSDHPNFPWLVLDKHIFSHAIVEDVLRGWGTDVRVDKFLSVVADRFAHQLAQAA